MASVTVTETLEVNQIAVTTDNPVTSVTVEDATSIDSVAVTESGSDIAVTISPNAAGVSSLNGLTGVVQVQEAITLQNDITVPGTLQPSNFTQGSLAGNGTFQSYAQNPVFHGYNLTIGGLNSGDNRQGITFASSTPTGQAYLYYNDLNDKLEQSRDGVNWIPVATSTTELAEGTNLYYTDARADARVAAGIANINYPVLSVNGQTNTVVLDTDDISEGSTNLYYTDARADARVSAGIAAIDYPVDSVNGKTNTVVLSTTDIGEGTNLYYTDARFDSRLASKTTANLAEGTNLYYTSARANADFDTRLATKTTDNLNEGTTNQYFTTARARQAIQVNDLGGDGSIAYNSSTGVISYTGPSASEVRAHFTGGTGVTITDGSIAIGQAVGTTSNVTFNDGVFNGNLTVNGTATYVNTTDLNITDRTITIAYGQTGTPTQNAGIIVDRGDETDSELRWNEATDKWEQVRAGTATVLPINTTELAEGTNLYYTTARANSDFDTRLATKSTTDLAEGTNLYYTDARARAAISVTDTGGDGSLSYNNSTGVITYTGPGASEVRAHFSGGTGVSITDGVIAIGQSVATTADVVFDQVTATNVVTSNIAPTSGNFTVTTTSTGDIQLTTANGGNIVASRNYVYGDIRNATTKSNGDIWSFSSGSGVGSRGVTLSNSTDTTKRPGIVVRSYGGGLAGGGPRSGLLFEATRGSAASPSALTNNNFMGEFSATGYTSTGWLSDLVAGVPATQYFYATENWTGVTNTGTGWQLSLQPTATTFTGGAGLIPVIVATPQAVTQRSDAFNFRTRAGTTSAADYLSLASTGAIIKNGSNTELANFATGTATVSADNIVLQKSNGTDLANFASDNTYVTSTKTWYQHTTLTATKGGEITMKAGILNGATAYNRATELSVTALTTDGSSSATYETKTNRFDGTNYSPTQANDQLGRFTFLGNYGSSTQPLSVNAAGTITVRAAENFTATASGTSLALTVNKLGTNDGLNALDLSSTQSTYRSDAVAFQDSSLVPLVGNKISYNRVYAQWEQDGPVTPAAANTSYVFAIGNAVDSNIASVVSTSRITPGAAGRYNLQFSLQWANSANAEHKFYVWLRKNGVNVTNSTGEVTCLKSASGVNGWNYIISSANATDYWELAYQVSDTAVTFPYVAAFGTAPNDVPACPALITTLTPVGA